MYRDSFIISLAPHANLNWDALAGKVEQQNQVCQ